MTGSIGLGRAGTKDIPKSNDIGFREAHHKNMKYLLWCLLYKDLHLDCYNWFSVEYGKYSTLFLQLNKSEALNRWKVELLS